MGKIEQRIKKCDYLSLAQIYLQDNFELTRPLVPNDIKPRLLGHWGTCHGINVAYANLAAFYQDDPDFSFVLGPGHGFPALQANLFYDGKLDISLAELCRRFSWPDGFPSHASPMTPGIITEGGELGYALASAYGLALGHPEKTIAVLIGDGELETATALASLNLNRLLGSTANGRVLPILHLNGYKISAPSLYARKPEKELNNLIRGFDYEPAWIDGEDNQDFQSALAFDIPHPFYILQTEKGAGGPILHQDAHQVPLKNPKTDEKELALLEKWLRSYQEAK